VATGSSASTVGASPRHSGAFPPNCLSISAKSNLSKLCCKASSSALIARKEGGALQIGIRPGGCLLPTAAVDADDWTGLTDELEGTTAGTLELPETPLAEATVARRCSGTRLGVRLSAVLPATTRRLRPPRPECKATTGAGFSTCASGDCDGVPTTGDSIEAGAALLSAAQATV